MRPPPNDFTFLENVATLAVIIVGVPILIVSVASYALRQAWTDCMSDRLL